MKITDALNDNREILSISLMDENLSCYRVGNFGVTKITAYGQGGMHCDVLWFLVENEHRESTRVNGSVVGQIEYMRKERE